MSAGRARLVLAVAIGAATVAGCSREARSSPYFEAHPEERASVLAACEAGSQRGAECEAARVADLAAASKDRRSATRKMLQDKIDGGGR